MSSKPSTFDAPGHMRKIRTRQGMQDYLDVKWRVAWVRADFPAAQIVTCQVEGSADHARFHCLITLPNGAVGSGHGSETLQDFPDFYEKAETKAIGRACAVLGYGTDAANDFDDGEPMDGRAAAKDERATRRTPQDAPHEAEPPAKVETPAQRPTRPQRPAERAPTIPTSTRGEWKEEGVDQDAPRVDAMGQPVPSIQTETRLQALAVDKGLTIMDGSNWRIIANIVAAARAGRADVGWPSGKLVTKDVYEALQALPDAPR